MVGEGSTRFEKDKGQFLLQGITANQLPNRILLMNEWKKLNSTRDYVSVDLYFSSKCYQYFIYCNQKILIKTLLLLKT